MDLHSFASMNSDSLIKEGIKKLEEVKNELSNLSEGSPIARGVSSRSFPKMEALSPIVKNLNTVIEDLKKCVGQEP